jgi:hypothetical protein
MMSLVEVVAVYVGASLIRVHVVAQPEPDVGLIGPVRKTVLFRQLFNKIRSFVSTSRLHSAQ